jgi:hypothetical protein
VSSCQLLVYVVGSISLTCLTNQSYVCSCCYLRWRTHLSFVLHPHRPNLNFQYTNPKHSRHHNSMKLQFHEDTLENLKSSIQTTSLEGCRAAFANRWAASFASRFVCNTHQVWKLCGTSRIFPLKSVDYISLMHRLLETINFNHFRWMIGAIGVVFWLALQKHVFLTVS